MFRDNALPLERKCSLVLLFECDLTIVEGLFEVELNSGFTAQRRPTLEREYVCV